MVDRLKGVDESTSPRHPLFRGGNPERGGDGKAPRAPVVGIAVEGRSDSLVLQMLGQLLDASGLDLVVINDAESPLEVTERVAELSASMVVASTSRRAN